MSEIDRYLDELFDRMSGTGAAGRRALAEAEDHLRAAAADAMAAGLPADRAERDAVARFGRAAMVARRLRAAHRATLLNRVLSAGWLLAGLAAAGLGVAYLAAAGRLDWSMQDCAVVLTRFCYLPNAMVRDAEWAAIAAAIGAVLLLTRWIAVSHAGLAQIRWGFVILAGLAIALAALAAVAVGRAPVPRFLLLLPYSSTTGIVIVTAIFECLAATAILASPRPRRGAR